MSMDPHHPHTTTTTKPISESHKTKPNTTQLISSAKVVAEAAKSTLRHEIDKVDKAKVAEAAADLLGAASQYANLEERSFGKYVEQAENYLHQYQSSHAAHSSTEEEGHSSSAHASSGLHSEGGFGDYLKLAEGFLKKH